MSRSDARLPWARTVALNGARWTASPSDGLWLESELGFRYLPKEAAEAPAPEVI